MAGTEGAIRLEDFVIPRSERECSFEVRDRKFLNSAATKIIQRTEERTVRIPVDSLTLCGDLKGCADQSNPSSHR